MIINDPPVCVCVDVLPAVTVCVDGTPQEAPPRRCSYGVCDVECIGAACVRGYIMDHERPPVSHWLCFSISCSCLKVK